MNQRIWVGIVISVFFVGIGVSYAIFSSPDDPNTMKFQNQQLFDQMMSQNPKMAAQWVETMMQEYDQEQEQEQELRSMSIQELEKNAVSWEYGDLLRNPEKYKGKIIEFDGEIFIVYSPGKDHYQFLIWYDGLDQLIVDWKGGRLLSGDEIRGFGTFDGVVDVGSMLAENYYNPKPYVTGIHLVCTSC